MKNLDRSEIEVPESVSSSVLSQDKVDEAPHSFYKYPARFSPVFAREAIKAFTRKGETVHASSGAAPTRCVGQRTPP